MDLEDIERVRADLRFRGTAPFQTANPGDSSPLLPALLSLKLGAQGTTGTQAS
jgi:hypothetical protein